MERKRTGHLMVRITVVGLLLVGLVRPVSAHNGAVAIAVPVEGIVVDGDLSDWPAAMRRYSIELVEEGDVPTDGADYQGDFRIGFNEQENALYIAVEVQDESVVKEGTARDGCRIFLDLPH
ncbi:MAG: penicillin-binding protein, partial [Dehalococcoidia bacterium]|nr:penicillin-binding protein [Dehalococcoidia bacterium]